MHRRDLRLADNQIALNSGWDEALQAAVQKLRADPLRPASAQVDSVAADITTPEGRAAVFAKRRDFDIVVTVEAPEEEQIKRMVAHRGMTATEAKSRIATQAKPVERAARADRILSSNQDIHLLLRDADALWREIERLAATKAAQN